MQTNGDAPDIPASSPEALWSVLRKTVRFLADVAVSPAVLFADLFRKESDLARRWVANHVLLSLVLTVGSQSLTWMTETRMQRALGIYETAMSLRQASASLPYADIVNMEAARYGLDPMLVASVIQSESAFDPDAVSPQSAKGLMQVLPSTWMAFNPDSSCDGLHDPPSHGPDCIFDPAANISTGTAYLRQLLEDFQGDTVMAIAAYNAGVVAVSVGKKAGRGSLGGNGAGPYQETQAFVRGVLSRWGRWRGQGGTILPSGVIAWKVLTRAARIVPALSVVSWGLLAGWLFRRQIL